MTMGHGYPPYFVMEVCMLPEKLKKKYTDFYEATVESGTIDARTTVMIQLAASFAIGCYP